MAMVSSFICMVEISCGVGTRTRVTAARSTEGDLLRRVVIAFIRQQGWRFAGLSCFHVFHASTTTLARH
jgi:hypothetical protein